MEKQNVKFNRAQALAFFNLSQRLSIGAEIEITHTDNYGALAVESDGQQFTLPRAGGVVPVAAADRDPVAAPA